MKELYIEIMNDLYVKDCVSDCCGAFIVYEDICCACFEHCEKVRINENEKETEVAE